MNRILTHPDLPSTTLLNPAKDGSAGDNTSHIRTYSLCWLSRICGGNGAIYGRKSLASSGRDVLHQCLMHKLNFQCRLLTQPSVISWHVVLSMLPKHGSVSDNASDSNTPGLMHYAVDAAESWIERQRWGLGTKCTKRNGERCLPTKSRVETKRTV